MKQHIKKIAAIVAISAMAASSLQASFIADTTNTKALKAMKISGSYAQSSLGDTDSSGYNIEFGMDYDFTENWVGGITLATTSISDLSTNVNSIGFMAGYKPIKNTTTYIDLTYDYNSDGNMDGVGYAFGVKYQVFNYIAVNAKYHMATLSAAVGPDIDYNTATIGLEFNFKTVK